MENKNKLIGNINAEDWAREFIKTTLEGNVLIDYDLMRLWFSNAIMTGFDKAMDINREGL